NTGGGHENGGQSEPGGEAHMWSSSDIGGSVSWGGGAYGGPKPNPGAADGGISESRTDCRTARLQPLAGATGGTGDPPLYRPGLRLQRLQAPAHEGNRHHRARSRRLDPTRGRP